jgi:hypothetical protein
VARKTAAATRMGKRWRRNGSWRGGAMMGRRPRRDISRIGDEGESERGYVVCFALRQVFIVGIWKRSLGETREVVLDLEEQQDFCVPCTKQTGGQRLSSRSRGGQQLHALTLSFGYLPGDAFVLVQGELGKIRLTSRFPVCSPLVQVC